MRRRAFMPVALCGLERRIVPSTAIGHIHGAYGLSAETYGQGIAQIKNAFQLYGVSGNFERLRSMLAANGVGVPYHRATMQGAKTNALLDQMLANIHAHAPHPIRTAMHMDIKSTHEGVRKLIDGGAVFVKESA